MARLTLVVLAFLALPHIAPVVPAESLGLITEFLAETVLALMVLLALRYRFAGIESKPERRFWNLVTLSASLTLGVEAANLLLSDEAWSRLPLYAADVVALLAYFVIFVAVEFKPHLQDDAPTPRRKIEIAASMVFASSLCIYVLAIPAFAGATYDEFAPAMFTFTVLDAVLAFRAWSLSRRCSTRRWRIIYWWLAAAYGAWAVVDFTEFLMYSNVIREVPAGTPLDFMWYLPFLALTVFGLVKHHPTLTLDGPDNTVHAEPTAPTPGVPTPLVAYAFLFSFLHLSSAALNLFERRSGFAENAFTLSVLLILAVMAWAQQNLLAGEREQALAEARAAREAAETASRAKLQFLASMSHEVRTPINGVLGMLELLAHTELTQRQAGFANSARKAGRHLLHVISGILDISKIEAGKLVLESNEFDLCEALEETVHIFAEGASEKGLELACDIGEAVPRHVVGDEGRLRQILANLVGNAVKFTSSGSVLVNVDRISGEAVVLRISVKDTGIGVSAEQREELFEAFTQADDSVTRKYGGTGLGLAIAKQLCEAMGGQIGVDSDGGGSEFWFTVSLGAGEGADRPRTPTADSPWEQSGASRHTALNLRVLLVEDNAVNVEVARGMLEAFDCRVEVCSNGREALDALDRCGYDVILMDCQMPEMDGYEATTLIRARKDGRERIPIIALTAHAFRSEREKCLAVGMDEYLSKPFEQTDLLGVLERWGGTSSTRVSRRPVEAGSPRS